MQHNHYTTLSQAAVLLGVTASRVSYLAREGRVARIKGPHPIFGRETWLYSLADLKREAKAIKLREKARQLSARSEQTPDAA